MATIRTRVGCLSATPELAMMIIMAVICCSTNHSLASGASPQNASTNVFDVGTFGAKGDGKADDTQAFISAWSAACAQNSSIIKFPSGSRFLISPVTFTGPCKPGLVIQIDGVLAAPTALSAWPKQGTLQWLSFWKLQYFSIQGSGLIDGQGSSWWGNTNNQGGLSNNPKVNPTALRLSWSNNITVTGIQISNSPMFHLTFDFCNGVKVANVTIQSPGDSPNTDGIHLQGSRDVEIMNSSISSGDDCISVQTGSSNVYIHNVRCGPGHGISVGGLGKDGSTACVSNVKVQNCTMEGTPYGVRIKTWQGGLGSARSISFSDIKMNNVKIPIAINQYYCDKSTCSNKTNAVAISNISYDNIKGTYTLQPVYIACSDTIPCSDLRFGSIVLAPSAVARRLQQSFCWKAFGGYLSTHSVQTGIGHCLNSGKLPSNTSSNLLC